MPQITKAEPINMRRANMLMLGLSALGCIVVTAVLATSDLILAKNFNSVITPTVAGAEATATPTVSAPAVTVTAAPTYKVVGVTDGDTITLLMNGEKQKVRLLGIDTPESVKPNTPVQCFAIAASNKTKELLDGQDVLIETDESQGVYDKYNRMLLYIWRASDNLFINDYLVREGYAHEYTYNKPYKYQQQFRDAEKLARESNAGLWGPQCNGKP